MDDGYVDSNTGCAYIYYIYIYISENFTLRRRILHEYTNIFVVLRALPQAGKTIIH